MNILMIGDVSGKPGLYAIKKVLPTLIANHKVDFVVANGENVAAGVGITSDLCRELLDNSVDCVTTGNHVWRHHEITRYIDGESRLLRPHNFHQGQPGTGMGIYRTASGVKIGVVNLGGRVFMNPADCPFAAADKAIEQLESASLILVDFHAEATSEKRAMGIYLDGRVTAVVGTHTHIQTADEQIQKKGTAYITDVGMTGPHDSVIGMRTDLVLDRFVRGMPHSFKVAKRGARFQAVFVKADPETGLALSVERIDRAVDE